MLGLERGEVSLASHDASWKEEAQRTIEHLRSILGTAVVDIQHVGSTAVPGILAKPIIDIAVGVGRLDGILPLVPELECNGFVFRGQDVPGQLLFVRGSFEKDTRTHHIHVVEWDGTEWRNYIGFRDLLRSDPEAASRYETCKKHLAERFPHDRKHYTGGKAELIAQMLRR